MIGLPFFGAGTQDIWLSTNVVSYMISIVGILLAGALLLHFATSKAAQRSRETRHLLFLDAALPGIVLHHRLRA